MSLGSVPMTTIDIDFIRAQGHAAVGRITFSPTRQRIGDHMLSSSPIEAYVVGGKASIALIRLPIGLYKVSEEIDGKIAYNFSFVLSMFAPEFIRYETIAPITPALSFFTGVRTINGETPDPLTGDLEIAADGGTPASATTSTQGVLRLAGHLSGTADSPQLSAAILKTIEDSYVLPDLGMPSSHMTSAVQTLLGVAGTALQPGVLTGLALPDRIVRVRDRSQTDGSNTYNMPNTVNEWAFFIGGPGEYTIEANIGDDIEVAYNYLIAGAESSHVDLAVVTGGVPTRQRHLSSGTSATTWQGSSGSYPNGAGFEGRSGVEGFTVQASDLDSGFVRIRWVVKTSTDGGKMYANDNYPMKLSIRNTRLSGL